MSINPYDQIHHSEKLPVVERRVMFDEIAFVLVQELANQRGIQILDPSLQTAPVVERYFGC